MKIMPVIVIPKMKRRKRPYLILVWLDFNCLRIDKLDTLSENFYRAFFCVTNFQYRYSNKCEKFLVIIALSLATLTSAVIPLSNLSFGQFTKIMVDYASNASRQCPPPDTGQTSPFMKNVEMFALYQSSLAVFQFVAGYLFVMCLNYVAEKQVYLKFVTLY